MEIDRYLSKLTRRLSSVRGMGRLIKPLRKYYAKHYAGREDRWIIINDYDGNLRMLIDRSCYMGASIYWAGFHHLWELSYLEKVLRPNMIFVDVGANQGEFTLFAAKRLHQGIVLAFEPQEQMFELLQKNVEMNNFSNVRLFKYGLGNGEGCAALYTSLDTTLHDGWHEGLFTLYPSDYRNNFVQTIPLKRLDTVLLENGIDRVDIIKIDVEGAELFVLQGAEKLLELNRPKLLLEINEETFNQAGYSTADLLDFLSKYDYRFYKFLRGGRLEQVDVLEEASRLSCFNVWCQGVH